MFKQITKRISIIKIILALDLFLILTNSRLEQYEYSSLPYHMIIGHILYCSIGFLITSGLEDIIQNYLTNKKARKSSKIRILYKNILILNNKINPYGILAIMTIMTIIIYWHIPTQFNSAVSNNIRHIQMHSSFIVIGAAFYTISKKLSKIQIVVLVIAIGKIAGITGFYFTLIDEAIYTYYSLIQHGQTGTIMIIMMMMIDIFSIPYIIYSYLKKS